LFVDMFSILGLTIERKQEKLTAFWKEKNDRMINKITVKERNK